MSQPEGQSEDKSKKDSADNEPNSSKTLSTKLRHALSKLKEQFFPPAPVNSTITPSRSRVVGSMRERLSNLASDNMKIMYSFMKAIALTAATIILLRLIDRSVATFDWNANPDFIVILLFAAWVNSLQNVLITYDAAMFGTLLVFDPPPRWLTVVPAVLTVFEFMVFAVLIPESETKSNTLAWQTPGVSLMLWFLVNGIYHWFISGFCWVVVRYYIRIHATSKDPGLKEVVLNYLGHIRVERNWTFVIGLISFSALAFRSDGPGTGSTWFHIVWSGFIILLLMFIASQGHKNQYELKRKEVIQLINKHG